MKEENRSRRELLQQIEELQNRLAEAEETLQAIHGGEVDAILVSGGEGEKVFTLQGADHPYRIFIENMNEGAVTLLPDASVAYSNSRFAEMVKTPLPAVIASSFFRYLPPAQEALFKNLLERNGREGGKAEFSLLARDGSLVPVQLSLRPLEERESGAFCVVATDLTRQKEAERTRSFLASIVESTDVSIVGTTMDGTIVSWNCGAESIYGYSAEEMVGRSIAMIQRPGSDELQHILDRIRQGESVEPYDTLRIGKGGRLVEVMLSVSPIRDAAGRITGASSIARDVTARKRAEAARQSAEANLFATVESTDDMIWSVDLDYRLRTFNDATQKSLEELFGVRAAVGMAPEDLPAPARTPGWPWLYERALSEGPFRVEYSLVSGRTFELAFNPILQGNRKTGVSVFGKEITERKRAEEEIKQLNARLERRVAELLAANKELEAFSYSVSHDLRAPLRAMDGFSQMLIEDYGDKLDLEGKTYLQHVRDASQRMDQLVDGILNLSRTSRTEIRRAPMDLSAMAQGIARQIASTEPGRQVEFVVAPGMQVSADPILLRSVMDNLLSNAWKFTSKHPQARIEVGTVQQQGETVYFVRDDGAGFDMAYSHKLFGAFQRLHTPAEFAGTGIGLAIVHRIIQRHGGRIWAQAAVEKGATFFFTMPVGQK